MEGGAPVEAWLGDWAGLSEQRGTTKKRAGLGVWAELREKRRPIGWRPCAWEGLRVERLPWRVCRGGVAWKVGRGLANSGAQNRRGRDLPGGGASGRGGWG